MFFESFEEEESKIAKISLSFAALKFLLLNLK